MNDQTIKLIEALANKLGIATQEIWNILLNHALIDFIGSFIQLIILIISWVIAIKYHKIFSNDKDKEGNHKYSEYYNYEYKQWIIGISFGLLTIISIIYFFCINNIINSLLDPQYWALEKAINIIK